MAERTRTEAALYERVAEILEAARTGAARSVNVAMVRAYWLIGREIVQVEQGGKRRAGYGDQLLERLAQRLRERGMVDLSVPSLRRTRQFYLTYPAGSCVVEGPGPIRAPVVRESGAKVSADAVPSFPSQLAWRHYVALMKVENLRRRPRRDPLAAVAVIHPRLRGGEGKSESAQRS